MNARFAALDAFHGVISELGGTVTREAQSAQRVYVRAILPFAEEVQPGDFLKFGVALRASELAIQVVPCVFREVCLNSALWGHSSAAYHLTMRESGATAAIGEFVRVHAEKVASARVFADCIEEVQAGRRRVTTPLGFIFSSDRKDLVCGETETESLMRKFMQLPGTLSHYDAMNALTALARDVADPEVQWSWEKIGPALLLVHPKPGWRVDSSLAARHAM